MHQLRQVKRVEFANSIWSYGNNLKIMSAITINVGDTEVSMPAKIYHTLIAVHNHLRSFSFAVAIGNKNNLVKYFFTCDAGEVDYDSESGSESQEDQPEGSVTEEELPVAVLEVDDLVHEFDYNEFWDAMRSKKVIERNRPTWRKFELIDLDSKICLSRCNKTVVVKGKEEHKRSTWLEVDGAGGEPFITIDLASQPLQNFSEGKFGVELSPTLIDVIKLFVG